MLAGALVLFPAVVAALQTPAAPGKGFAKPAPAPPQAAGRTPLVSDDFLKWAEKSGIKTLEPIAVGEVAGERGVVASADFAAGARVLSVPSSLSLQVTSLTPCPRWCDEEVWKTSKWDARMAMMLLHEESDKRSALKPWLAQLPRAFATPVTWQQPADAFEAIGYRALATGVDRQRKEWDASRLRAPGSPSAKEWDWAMNVIRSRAFSGPYSPGTFIGSLTTLFGASTLAVAYALIVGGAVRCGFSIPILAGPLPLALLLCLPRGLGSETRHRRVPQTRRSTAFSSRLSLSWPTTLCNRTRSSHHAQISHVSMPTYSLPPTLPPEAHTTPRSPMCPCLLTPCLLPYHRKLTPRPDLPCVL